MKTGPKPRTIEELIDVMAAKSYEKDGCYIWRGRTIGEGYGVICYQGKEIYIHRLIYEYVSGEIALVVRHSCDNRRCWYPDHLFNGTHADNVQDKVNKKRHLYGEKVYNAILTEDKVREIRTCGLSLAEMVKKFGASKGAIHCALTRKTWKHI